MRQIIEHVIGTQIKAIGKHSDVCSVKINQAAIGHTAYSMFTMTFRAYASLCKLSEDIQGEYTLELLQYHETNPNIVTDVILITK